MRRLAAAVAVAVGLGFASAGPVLAAGDTLDVAPTRVSGSDHVGWLLTARDLPDGTEPDPASVSVRAVDGPTASTLQAHGVLRSGQTQQKLPPPTVMLVIDTSGSMKSNDRIGAAKQAAQDFLSGLPADVKVGLVTFGDEPQLVQTPTTPAVVAGSLGGLQANGETALYKAVVVAAQQLVKASGTRTVVLLTDGANTQKSFTEDAAVTALATVKAALTTVSFGTKKDELSQLKHLTTRARGAGPFIARNASQLSSQFQREARKLSNQVLVDVQVPAALRGHTVTLTVTIKAGNTLLSSTGVFIFPAPATAASPRATAPAQLSALPPPGPIARSAGPVLWVALVALFVALATVIATVLGAMTVGMTPVERTRRRLAIYSIRGSAPQKLLVHEEREGTFGGNFLTRSAVDLADRVAGGGSLQAAIEQRLEAAGVPLRAAEWVVLHTAAALGLMVLAFLLTGGRLLGALLGLLLGAIGPWVVLIMRKDRRERAFLNQLPDTLLMLAGSLRAGYSTPQALDAVVREGQPPISSELNRALVEARLGASIEDALDGVATRMGSRDFTWVVMAIRVQRQVGGNLAELLSTVSGTMRERERLRRQVRSLSAEGKLSAWILGLLPIIFALYMALVRPEYVGVLVTDPRGISMLVVAVVLMLIGAVWLRRVVAVKI